jgi:hypothetical protein
MVITAKAAGKQKPLFIGLNKGFEWLRENCLISLKHRWPQQRCDHQANNGQYID